jgi:hypothetical protein
MPDSLATADALPSRSSAMEPWKCSCGLTNPGDAVSCRRCNNTLLDAKDAIRRAEREGPKCGACGGKLLEMVEYPNRNTGRIVIVLGILLAPVLIGIPMLYYGYSLTKDERRYRQCAGCGAAMPIG